MSFTDRLSGALDKIADAHAAEVSALRTRLSATQRIVDAIPSCYPDGTAILSPEQWLTWATGKLGYAAGVGASDGETFSPQTPMSASRCHLPPLGWHCTRPAGHEGPCAAYPTKVT